MIFAWGKIVGLGLGAFGGVVGAAFGLLVGHLLDVVAAQWLLRRTLQRILGKNTGRASRQVSPRRAFTALAIASVSAPDWSPGVAEREIFRERTEFWENPDAPEPGHRRTAITGLLSKLLARGHSRCLDASLSLKAEVEADTLAERTRDGLTLEQRRTLVEITRAVLDLDPRASVRGRLREFALLLGLSEEWVESILPSGPGPEPAAADDEAWVILGVPPDADLALVKRTYRRLAAQFHPDTAAGLSSDQREQTATAFVRIRSAYERIVAGLEN